MESTIMGHGIPHFGWACLLALSGVLSACAPPMALMNTAHPQYGVAEYQSDLTQCRNQVVISFNYEEQVGGCMASHGWQLVSEREAVAIYQENMWQFANLH
jgi:hypothetical protein